MPFRPFGRVDSLNLDTSFPDLPSRTSTTEQPEAELLQPLGEGKEAGFVVHREKGWCEIRSVTPLEQPKTHQWELGTWWM